MLKLPYKLRGKPRDQIAEYLRNTSAYHHAMYEMYRIASQQVAAGQDLHFDDDDEFRKLFPEKNTNEQSNSA